MSHEIRRQIIREILLTGHAPTVENMASKVGMDLEAFRRELNDTPPASDLGGLSPEQARELINAYGDGVIFEAGIEKSLKQLEVTREEIKKKEQRFS
jgi:hypothetical protein